MSSTGRRRVRRRLAPLLVLLCLVQPASALAAAPSAIDPPTVPGAPREAQPVTAANGTWAGAPTKYTYQWLRCDDMGNLCHTLSGKTTLTYAPVAADVDLTLRVDVTATNADGLTRARSAPSTVVTGTPPASSSPPTVVAPYLRSGHLVTAKPGTWNGTKPIAFAYAWSRCPATGPCVAIAGATADTYLLTDADIGARIIAGVTASNVSGTGDDHSAPAGPIGAASPPVMDPASPPAISGEARDSQTLTAGRGTWTGAATIAYTYRWQRCNAVTAACVSLPATAATYKLTPADVGSRMQVDVTASNPDATQPPVRAAATAVVVPDPPTAIAAQPPTITGAARNGQLLTGKPGGWTGTPTLSYAHQWQRCGPTCAPIAGATGTTYRLALADEGSTVVLRITAANAAAASATRDSVPTATVGPPGPPVSTIQPTFTGTARDGQQLTGAPGTWSGVTPMNYEYAWLRCDDADVCEAVTGSSAVKYTLLSADVGTHLKLRVTATNADGVTVAESDAGTAVEANPPVLTVVPKVTGVALEGSRLTATPGSYTGTAPLDYVYEWQRCSGGTCVAIPGAPDTAAYDLAPGEIGSTIRARVTASNPSGSAVAYSVQTAVVVGAMPVVTSILPAVSGVPRDGELLTATLGEWTGTAPLGYAYQWRRCLSTTCTSIPDATASTYRLTSDDYNQTIRVRVTATNLYGVVYADSPPTGAVAAAPPVNTTAPGIAGVRNDGQTLTATPGVWAGTPPMTYAYRWERFDSGAGEWVPITGATATTYVQTSADVDTAVRVRVTASNPAARPTVAYSPETYDTAPVPPVSTALPVVTGLARDGEALAATAGTWSGTVPQVRSHRWLRCAGATCDPIAGATQANYAVTDADVGFALRVEVGATNAASPTPVTARSNPTAAVVPEAPANVAAPVIFGSQRDGQTLSVDTGAWTGTAPIAFTYRWSRCPASTPTTCAPIDGATSETYELRTADVGALVRVDMTATNEGGSRTVDSAPKGPVLPSPPVSVTVPTVSGTTRDGDDLVASEGTWSGVVTFAYAYQWQHCSLERDNCGDIAGATGRSYRLSEADMHYTMRVQVIARNPGGSASAFSAITGAAEPRPPSSLTRPVITGHTGVNQELEAGDGVWAGTPALLYTRQWLRCDAVGGACTDIAGETAASYRLDVEDLGSSIRVRVRAVNDAPDDAVAESDPTRVVRDDPPVNEAAPGVLATGPVAVGLRLTATDGTWGGGGPLDASFRWLRCDAAGNGCTTIAGATERDYVPVLADLGARLKVTVTMDNGTGAASATSPATTAVKAAPPANTVPPLISAGKGLQPGADLNATTGTWTGASPIAYGYAWLRCDAQGNACLPVPGAVTSKLALSDVDVGHTLRARVTATNPTLAVVADSQLTDVIAALKPIPGKVTLLVDGGKARTGVTVRGDGGLWGGTGPIRYAYRWQRCLSTSDCQDVPSADGLAYALTEADVGKRVRLMVTAENVGGGVNAASPLTEVVTGMPPGSTARPSVGTSQGAPLRDGVDLEADPGMWSGTGPFTFTYQWQRCKADGAACKPIPRATGERYSTTAEDVGQRISVLVAVKSAAGKADAVSPATDEVAAIVPGPGTRPTVQRPPGALEAGSILSSVPGTFTGSKPMVLGYQWLRCDRAGRKCRAIAKATKATYALAAEDLTTKGLKGALRLAITARNAAGAATTNSLPFGGAVLTDSTADGGTGTGTGTPGLTGVSAKLLSKTRLELRFTCPKGKAACRGRLTLASPALSRGVAVRLKAGASKRWLLKLRPRDRVNLAKVKRVRATLVFTPSAGGSIRSKPVTLRPKR